MKNDPKSFGMPKQTKPKLGYVSSVFYYHSHFSLDSTAKTSTIQDLPANKMLTRRDEQGEATRLRAQLAEARKEIEALKGAGGSGGDGAGAAGDVPIDPALSNA